MSEDKVYRDGDIVWVKLGNNWWPGEVTGSNRHPEGLIKHLKRVPYCVVKFFNESTYEYVRSSKQIFPFQCAKKDEFIRKGYSLYNSGNSFMEKFPNDVEMAKRLTHPKESSLIINDRPDSIVKAILGQPLIRTCDEYFDGTEYREKRRSGDSITKILNITQNRNDESLNNDKHGSQTSTTSKLPNNKTKNVANTTGSTNMSNYQCNMCDFTSVRQNVMILHRKMHSNRNTLGSSNTSSSSSTTTNAKSTPLTVGAAVATTTNTNQSKQNEIVNKNKTISKTKVNTNTTTVTGTARTTRTSIPVKETNTRATPATETNAAAIDAAETAITPLTPKEKNNRISKTQTPTNQGKTNKSKTGKKTVVKEKKEESAYATILSDFCTSDSETSPSAEEKQSRRSLRHCKNLNENTTGKVSSMVCIDLSETKIIQKIPKKREYSSLQLQKESLPEITTPVVVADPDVVCLADKETETATTTPSTAHSANTKKDAEDIRRMLLADWSDDDETPNDAIVVEDSVILENAESNECISDTVNEQQTATAVLLTSTPVVKSTPAPTGRIRNIPKKDRRDVVLQDFNSDLSVIQADKVEQSNKCMAVDLDSSNSSVVEIIEDEQSATIITINDDEEQDISKSQKNPTDVIVTESKDNDSAVGLVNDKSASAATSTTTLSCFDFQEDEDEQETTNTTISHFKKKYLSVEKLQNISSNTDELREDIAAKSRAELAEKDQRLTAEIESLLEQTQPPVADLLNTSSFEESISVKDLPIKERGKRIFKSRNKTRTEEKTNGDVVSTTTVEAGATTEQNKSMETPTTVEEVVNNDQDNNEPNMEQTSLIAASATAEQYNSEETPTILEEIVNSDKDKNEGNLQQESEIRTDKELMIMPDQDNLSNKKCLVEISSQEGLYSSNAELPKYLEEKQLTPNENKENQDLTGGNKDSSEVANGDYNTSEIQKEQMEKEKAFGSTDANTNNEEESIQNMPIEQEDNLDNDDSYTNQPLNDQEVTTEQQEVKQVAEKEVEQDDLVEDGNENCADIEKFKEIEFDNDEDNKKPPKTPEPAVVETEDNEINDIPVNNVITSESQTSELSKTNLDADLNEESFRETEIPQSPEKNINEASDNDKQLKTTMTGTNDDIDKNVNQQQCSENVFKIRVKSPDQLFDNAFAIDSHQEQELQPNIDVNGDTRLITTTPTDENSSMGASDTGAEFGSPTSMLSDERLPTFRFQGNQTPQQEIAETAETTETESQEENSQETVHEETVAIVGKTEPDGEIKENIFKGIPQIYGKSNQKLLQQRRFSMDSDVLQTEPKSFKRQRLSVDDTATNFQNSFAKSQDVLMPFTSPQDKSGGRIRPKSRHMKITPRRNVSELFKTRLSMDNQASKVIGKSISLESVKETQPVEEVVGTDLEKDLENHKKQDTIVAENNENSNEVSNSTFEKCSEAKQHQQEDNCMASLDNPEQSEESSENNDLEETTDNKIPEAEEDKQECSLDEELISKTTPKEKTVDGENIEDSNVKETDSMAAMEVETETTADKDNTSAITNSPTYVTTTEISMPEVVATNPDENEQNEQNEPESSIFADKELDTAATENTPSPTTNNIESNLKNDGMMEANQTPNLDAVETAETPTKIVNSTEDNYISTSSIKLSLDTSKTHNEQGLDNPFSPGIPPPTPQESEVVIESENLSQLLNTQHQTKTIVESETEITIRPLTPKGNGNSNELIMPVLTPQEKEPVLDGVIVRPETPKENEPLNERILCPLTPQETEHKNETPSRPITPQSEISINKCETLTKPATPQAQDMTVELENNISMPCTPQDNFIDEIYENPMQTPSTPQAKDLIIECEPSTPQGIIECDHNIPAQVTPEKEVIIESDVVLATPPSVSQEKNIIVEESLQLEEKDTLLEKEFQVIQPKEMPNQPDAAQTNTLQTDADKAAEEFLIEFDSIVNHSHSVEEDVPNSSVEDGINAEDLINNIIEEVHEDQQIKQDAPTVTESPLQFEPLTTYTVVAAKNSWNQIFKESFHRQLPPAKRRQTICFEISDTKEGVACKKQALDFESILPVSKTVKRTAERKLTLPAIETKLSNSHRNQNILALNHNPLTLNRKLIPTTKRKLSIEDNITSFIIERPKQPQPPASAAGGPPPLQRIRPLSRQDHSRASIDSFSEPPPLRSHDNLYHELFQAESTSPTPSIELPQKTDGARVIHQQILNPPAVSSIPHTRTSDSKISKNKQIGVDSRGNKYVIIKTPPTNIIVQPTLTSSTSAAAVTATNNFGTTITIQPIPRSTSEVTITKATTKTKNVSASAPTSSRKQQQQHMKQISITVPAKSPLQISKPVEVAAKTPPRNRRKAAHAKAVAAAATANSNINSAKHRQAMEALSRRLSIATEAPPLAKLSRSPTTNVQTQISNNSNLTFFADTQLSNIAQQQLMQLQQQQQQQQQAATQTSSLPPPIILNKNAHQHSVIPRKPRKTLQQQQQQLQQQQQAADAAAKSSQLLQQLQQQQQNQLQQQQQHQQIQQHFITQIAAQPQQTQQQHNILQPPPLQQIQQQTVPVQQHQQQIIQQSDGIIITTTATEDDNVIDSNTQLIALPTQPYPGYAETFLLCKVKGNTCKPVDNVPLYLNHQLNELVPVPLEALEGGHKPQEHQIEIKATNAPQQMLVGQNNALQNNEGNLQITNLNCNLIDGEMSSGIEAEHQYNQHNQQQQLMEECAVDENASSNQIRDFGDNQDVNSELISNNGILLNIEGQQVLLDAATFAHLLANPDANTQLISDDGTEYVLTHEVLAALQMQQEQQQALELSNASAAAQQQQQQNLEQAGANDILAAALAGSELYDSEVLSIDTSQAMQIIDGDGSIVFPAQSGAINQQHLTPPAVVTNAVLDQSPIMSTLEVPSSIATQHKLHGTQLITVPSSHHLATSTNAALGVGRSNLEDSLAAIGVTTSSCISSSLGLPITVTNPNIASKVTSAGPLNEMLQFVSHRPATAAAAAAAVAAAALAGESRIFTD